jgi:hypothetical protein
MTRRELQKLAASMDVELDESYTSIKIDLDAWAPNGKRFKASGCHSIVVESYAKPTYGEARAEMAAQLRVGLEDCDDPDCEVCER